MAHPNVVKLLKYGSLDGSPYMVMELVDNATELSTVIEQREAAKRPFSLNELKQIIKQLLNGLQAAHDAHIVHRDIKPENIMLQKAPGHPILVRILDFGLAKDVSESRHTLHTMGTPAYVSPEQLQGKNIGPWSDLYAVGAITFELLTGHHPFLLDTVQEVIGRKLNPDYDPISQLAGLYVPSVVKSYFRTALSHDPEKRYRGARQLKSAFFEVLKVLEKDPIRAIAAGDDSTDSDDAFAQWMDQEKRRLDAQRRVLAKAATLGAEASADLHSAQTADLSSESADPSENQIKKRKP